MYKKKNCITLTITRSEITCPSSRRLKTRRGLINQLRVQKDSPGRLISFYLDAHIGGREHTFEEVAEKMSRVTKREVVEAARQVELDTVYLLRGEKGD